VTLPKSKRRDESLTLAPITVSVTQAISLSNLSEATLYDLIRKGKLRSSRVGRRHLIDYDSLREILLQPQPEQSRRGRPRKQQPAPQPEQAQGVGDE
jgi:excisionase family DNA binding protein